LFSKSPLRALASFDPGNQNLSIIINCESFFWQNETPLLVSQIEEIVSFFDESDQLVNDSTEVVSMQSLGAHLGSFNQTFYNYEKDHTICCNVKAQTGLTYQPK